MPNRTLEQRFADHEERLAHVEVVVEKQSKELDIQFKRIAQLQAELDQAHGNRQRQSRYRDPFREVGLASLLRPPEPTHSGLAPRAQPTARRGLPPLDIGLLPPRTSTSNSERIQNLAR